MEKALFDDPKKWLHRKLNLLGTFVLLTARLTTELVLAVYLHFQTVIIKGNRSFRYKFVLIQVISIRTQALKLLKKFNHFKYSLCVNKKNISGDYSSFFEASMRNYLQLD